MREVENIMITSVEDFLQEMVPSLGFQRSPIYRGQASKEWSLLPRLFRKEVERSEFSSWSELESALLLRFKQRAAGELGYDPPTELEWMSAGTSNGLPTRFSSWTENALVALYFATENHLDDDGVVWRILPGHREMMISQDFEQVPEQTRIYLPQKNSSEMLNQRTCYVAHPLPAENAAPETLEDYFELGEDRFHLARIVIPSTEKEFIRRRLAIMGIDSRSLFPGLPGLCGQIESEIYSHTDSYEWVFPE